VSISISTDPVGGILLIDYVYNNFPVASVIEDSTKLQRLYAYIDKKERVDDFNVSPKPTSSCVEGGINELVPAKDTHTYQRNIRRDGPRRDRIRSELPSD
jgi:hypothetical protein